MTREDIIRMAREAELPHYWVTGEIAFLNQLERFAKLVAEAEREACAKVAEEANDIGSSYGIAQIIRARGQQ